MSGSSRPEESAKSYFKKIPRIAAYETFPGFTNVSVLGSRMSPPAPSHSTGTCSTHSEKSWLRVERKAEEGEEGKQWRRSHESHLAVSEPAAGTLKPPDTRHRQGDHQPALQGVRSAGRLDRMPTFGS